MKSKESKKEDFKLVFDEALKGMGFVPNSLYMMSNKPNILGSFSLFYANVKGFSDSKTSSWTGLKLFFKSLVWTMKAKKSSQNEVPLYLKNLVAHISSNASGCRYCQAHTAHSAYNNGVSIEKLQHIWEFQSSDLFTDLEKAALDFGYAAGSTPNQVTDSHFEELRKYFTEEQVTELMATVAIFGFLNRWNDSMGTELEEIPLAFAKQYLSENWEVGKHLIKTKK